MIFWTMNLQINRKTRSMRNNVIICTIVFFLMVGSMDISNAAVLKQGKASSSEQLNIDPDKKNTLRKYGLRIVSKESKNQYELEIFNKNKFPYGAENYERIMLRKGKDGNWYLQPRQDMK